MKEMMFESPDVIERSHVDALIVDGLELHPKEFLEREEEGGIVIIHSRVTLTSSEWRKVRSLRIPGKKYFPVIRKGLGDEAPREMRLGRGYWSQDGSNVKYLMILVEKAYDAKQATVGTHYDQLLQDATATLQQQFSQLISTLSANGIVGASEVERIASIDEVSLAERRWDLLRVPDVDAEPL